MAKNVYEITMDQFDGEVLQSNKPVILDFYSTECPPCEAVAPKFEDLASYFGNDIKFLKIFRQQSRELATKLGVSSSPTLVFFKDGREVASRLSGGIKKKAILANIKQLISEDLYQRLFPKREIRKQKVDLLILGAGPAGLTAALYAAQSKLNTVLVDRDLPGGQVKTTHMIANFPGTEKAIPGWQLMHSMEMQVKDSGAKILSAMDVTKLELDESGREHKALIDDELEISAPALILAMGAEPRSLGVPGEKEYRGRGLSYCATCDGKFYEDREVIVIGGGNSAIEESLFLTKFVTKLTVVHQFDHLQANKTAQEKAFSNDKINFVWDSEPRKFEVLADNRVRVDIENVKTKALSSLETDGVFIFVGMAPNNEMLPRNLEKNQWGYIITDEDMQTNVPGVYAVGDIRSKKIRQAATAVGDGCIAAVIAEKHIAAIPVI